MFLLKIIPVGLIITLTCLNFTHAQWKFVGSPIIGQPVSLTADEDRIYVVATAGIFYSDDNGEEWSELNFPDSVGLPQKIYADGSHLFVLVNVSLEINTVTYVYRSLDGGNNWTKINAALGFPGIGSILVQGDTVLITGVGTAVSFDAGISFEIVENFYLFADGSFFQNNILYSADGFRSHDMTRTWQWINSDPVYHTDSHQLDYYDQVFWFMSSREIGRA